jgi:hypothetical protein
MSNIALMRQPISDARDASFLRSEGIGGGLRKVADIREDLYEL